MNELKPVCLPARSPHGFQRITLTLAFAAITAAASPVPTWVDYPFGLQVTNGAGQADDLTAKWTGFKAAFVVAHPPSGGQRVSGPESPHNGRTVSEGQAYGMIFAVYMDDRPVFDRLLQYKLWLGAQNGGIPPRREGILQRGCGLLLDARACLKPNGFVASKRRPDSCARLIRPPKPVILRPRSKPEGLRGARG